MTAMLIYKTTSPAAAKILDALAEERRVAFEATADFREKVTAQIGPGKNGTRTLVAWSRDAQPIGIEKVPGEETPRGWLDRGHYLLPDRRLKTGKAAAQRFAEMKFPKGSRDFTDIGMTSMALVGDRMYEPGMRRDGDTIYVLWGSRDVEEKVDAERAKHYAGTGVEWTTIPRSEWYALAEANGWDDK